MNNSKVITGKQLKDMLLGAYHSFEKNFEAINDLNVFPVPDGDTGTNMMHTMASVAKAISAMSDEAEAGGEHLLVQEPVDAHADQAQIAGGQGQRRLGPQLDHHLLQQGADPARPDAQPPLDPGDRRLVARDQRDPQVGAVTTTPPEAFSSEVASA